MLFAIVISGKICFRHPMFNTAEANNRIHSIQNDQKPDHPHRRGQETARERRRQIRSKALDSVDRPALNSGTLIENGGFVNKRRPLVDKFVPFLYGDGDRPLSERAFRKRREGILCRRSYGPKSIIISMISL